MVSNCFSDSDNYRMMTQFSDDSLHSEICQIDSAAIKDEQEGTFVTSSMLSRNSGSGLMDFIVINNDKVRYYCNKTHSFRGPIADMLGVLQKLHTSTFAYLSQLPEAGDYSSISMLFELIPCISSMIDWKSMNHTCYWDDFRRETKELINLLKRVNVAAMKCSDTAAKVLAQAQSLFKPVVETHDKSNLTLHKAVGHTQDSDFISDEPNPQNIQVHWKKHGDVIELLWHDADGGLLRVLLNQTGPGFRLRFLRHIIYHARACLENTYLTFMKINVSLHLYIRIEKLVKCQNVPMKQLSLHELTCLIKAKREFDSNLDTIWQMVSRFKFQAFHLLKYNVTFTRMRNSTIYKRKALPNFVTLTMTVEDSLLMRVMSCGIQAQAREESFDFTVFPDRTEDIVSKVEEMLTVDRTSLENLHVLLGIIKTSFPKERGNFTTKEEESTSDEIKMILAHRFQIRRTLKCCIELFEKHSAFSKMEKLKLLPPMKFVTEQGQSGGGGGDPLTSGEESGEDTETDMNTLLDLNNNERAKKTTWITLESGVKVSLGLDASTGILIKCHSSNQDAITPYNQLNLNERVTLNIRLLRQLLIMTANEQCWAKIFLGRAFETKSLVKRLKMKDRLNLELQNAIFDISKHMRLMLDLTKAMRFLKQFK